MAYLDEFGVPTDVYQSIGAAPFVQSRDEAKSKLAAQRAMKWRQRAAAFAAGLAASSNASNFGEGLLSGLGGSLAGSERFGTQEEERQQRMAEAQAREAERKAMDAYRQHAQENDDKRLLLAQGKAATAAATPTAQPLTPYDRTTQELKAKDDFLRAHPQMGSKPGGLKPTAFMQNVKALTDQGYSYEDAVAIAQRLVPVITTGTGYDPFAEKTYATQGSRTPQVPKRQGTVPSHGKKSLTEIFGK